MILSNKYLAIRLVLNHRKRQSLIIDCCLLKTRNFISHEIQCSWLFYFQIFKVDRKNYFCSKFAWMRRFIDGWYSPTLQKHMEVVTYGHYGFALLLLPTAGADYLEYERFQLIDTIADFINQGKVKVFSINSINSESWLHSSMYPHHKAMRHNAFNHYVYSEVIPYIKSQTSHETPIIVAGASLGALHSVNLFFRRPDLLQGVIAMSGVYDLTVYTKGFWNDDVYFNSPIHYLGNLHDHGILEDMRRSNHIHILAGSGDYEDPEASRAFSRLLHHKSIPHELDIWGHDMRHDWPTWRAMLPHYLGTRF